VFVDHIKIYARSGKGGDGSAHFRRVKYVPKGGPDGGDGGRGGDVIFEADPHTSSLQKLFYDPKVIVEDGRPGAGQKMTGKSGKNIIAKVPPGTAIYRATEPGLGKADPSQRGELVADLTTVGERFVLCEGGRGGKGNVHFKSSTNQAPQETTQGGPAEEGYYFVELRMIADVGLVGFPNAGKSTLVSQLSAAQPKVAAYPFTTLKPSVGVIEFPGFRRATIADIPGLIEGAHKNVGLGHEFLRHITRCRVLLFMLDMAGSEERDPIEDLEILRREIREYDAELARRSWWIVANKMDLPGADENLALFRSRFPKLPIFPVAAQLGTGLEELKRHLDETVGHRPE